MGELANLLYSNIDDNAQPREEVFEVGSVWATAPADESDPDLEIPKY